MILLGTSEPYLFVNGTGACSGIIDNVFVAKNSMNQRIMEENLRIEFSALEDWMSQTCHFASRKVLCASTMLRPQKFSMSSILFHNNISQSQIVNIFGNSCLIKTLDYVL